MNIRVNDDITFLDADFHYCEGFVRDLYPTKFGTRCVIEDAHTRETHLVYAAEIDDADAHSMAHIPLALCR